MGKASDSIVPYSRLAQIYDHVMRHVDYAHWANYVASLFKRHRTKPTRVLDLACGTGNLAVELYQQGYLVTGADGCREMLNVGEAKVRRLGYAIDFFHRNLLNLRDLPTFDAALCLYDSMNYMMTLEDMAKALIQVRRTVAPGGVFVFDICTESNSLRHFSNMTEEDIGDGFSYVRNSYYDDGIQYNKFNIFFEQTGEMVEELHRQRIYPLKDIEAVLEASPFVVEGAYGGFGSHPPTAQSDRVHFVLRNP